VEGAGIPSIFVLAGDGGIGASYLSEVFVSRDREKMSYLAGVLVIPDIT